MDRQRRVQKHHSWRRRRDSNPRYGNSPYGGLANRWFQPLTHVSGMQGRRPPREKVEREQQASGLYRAVSARSTGLHFYAHRQASLKNPPAEFRPIKPRRGETT